MSVRDPFGPKRNLLVEKAGPLVLGMSERVIMGRGEEYRLSLELVESQVLSPAALEALEKAIDSLARVRDKLNLPARGEELAWKPEQVALLTEALPAVVELAAGTPLSKLAGAAQRDVDLQSGRNNAVADLEARFRGQEVGDFSIRGTAGETLSPEKLKGQVTVLHFWDYRDEPLHEPYGQVGYLDFLYHRRHEAGLQLYGVAVNPRLGEASTRRRGRAQRKKAQSVHEPELSGAAGRRRAAEAVWRSANRRRRRYRCLSSSDPTARSCTTTSAPMKCSKTRA